MASAAFLLAACSAEPPQGTCESWEYALFTLSARSIIQNDVLTEVHTQSVWHGPKENGIWENGERLSGSISSSLTDHLGISSVNGPEVLNALGAKGWEAYGVLSDSGTDGLKTNTWHLKRCSH